MSSKAQQSLSPTRSLDGDKDAPEIPSPNKTKDIATDFYAYVNNNWQKHVHMPSFSASYGVSEEIEATLRDKLLALILDLRAKEPLHPLAVLADSFMNTSVQKNSIVDLQRITNTFECISSVNDACHAIGSLNKLQAHSPLSFVVSSDSNNSSDCVIYIYEAKLGLPEGHYYHTDNRILAKYSTMLKKAGALLNIENLEKAITIEATIEPFLTGSGSARNDSYSYNPVSFSTLQETYSSIAWADVLDGWGCAATVYQKTKFVVTNDRYVALVNKMCKVFDLETWRTWMRACVVVSFIEYLPPPFDDLHFELYGRALRGSSEKIPQKWLTLKVLQTYAAQDLSRLYVERVLTKGTKEKATDLINTLKHATVLRIQALDWMKESTRKVAIQKIQHMLFQVAYPGKWQSETKHTEMTAERPLMNILNLITQDSFHMLDDLKGKCGRKNTEWEDGAFVVNAYYYSEGNRMTIPAGMLQPPFFDMSRSKAWNYGGIGSAIGHEITHGFDDEGRMYDPEGNYKNWWSTEDEHTYTKMSAAVLELFDGVNYMGNKVDGKLTLSENIADLGGLAIALTALKSELRGKSETEIAAAYRDFFTSYAVSWRNKDRPRKAKQALLLDVHSPAPLRVNLIVRNFQEFYDAFGISETDPGYVPVEKRVKLW
jgi:hypothetical protein